MAFRRLGLSDYLDARTLYEGLSTGASLPPLDAGHAAFEVLLSHAGTRVFGIEIDDQIVSMATLHILPNMTYTARPYALVENVATLPAFGGKGYGRAVMEGVAQAAWDTNAYKIMLLTGRENKAQGFYTALGYDAEEKDGFVLRHP